MPTQYIKRSSTVAPASAKAHASPIRVDASDSNKLKVIPAASGSTEVELFDSTHTPKSSVNAGTVASNGGTVTVAEYGNGIIHKTIFTLTAMPLTLLDASQGNGTKIYDFPSGSITIVGAVGSVAETTTSTLASTLNAGVTYNWGVGTVTQSNGTLATTEQDIIPTTNGTASATINVAGATSTGARLADSANFDGNSTAKDAFFNVGVATATDIDGDATTTWTGTLSIVWTYNNVDVS